ncbi:MAG: class I SAM-dependent methyltransferase, partial [Pseudomonadota bacterium]
MSHNEQTLITTESISAWEKVCKIIFVNALKHMPEGFMVIREHGVLVAELGDPSHELKAEVNILNTAAYPKLLLGGSVASGETFTENLWETPDLTRVIQIFARNLSMLDNWERKFKWITMPFMKLKHWSNRNSATQAKKNISAHYDLGNKLYTKFLDESMMYSAAIYPEPHATLAEAQKYKLDAICQKLTLCEHDHLVEIGTGWGGLAIHAAENYGCKVTTTTISDEQFAWAAEKIAARGLSDRITLLKRDYRLLEGKYDKLVSIEMIEAVGKQ